jgi:hypothetical protein
MRQCLLLSTVLLSLSCGEGREPAEAQAPVQEQAAALAPLEPLWELELPPLRAGACTFLISAPSDQGRPPRYHLTVQRLESRACTEAEVRYASTYNPATLLAARRGVELAVAFSTKQTPSGAGLTHLEVRHLRGRTLQVVRTAFLGVPQGSTEAYSMYFAGPHLKLETNWGLVTLPDFLTSTAPPQGMPPPSFP